MEKPERDDRGKCWIVLQTLDDESNCDLFIVNIGVVRDGHLSSNFDVGIDVVISIVITVYEGVLCFSLKCVMIRS